MRKRVSWLATTTAIAGGMIMGVGPMSTASAATSPTPIYLNRAYAPTERAADLVSRMTLAEKAQQMISSKPPAIPRLGVASWGWWNESNHGVNALQYNPNANAT